MKLRLGAKLAILLCTYVFGFHLVHGAEVDNSDKKNVMDFFRTDPDIEFPKPAPLLNNVYARNVQSLNGPWEIIVDEARKSWSYVSKGHYFTEKNIAEYGTRLIENSFDKRRQLQVPGDWNTQDSTLYRYRGRVVYHKNVPIQKREDERYYLHFGGANYISDLFVNGKLVGQHKGGYTAFNFDVTDFVSDGDNTLIVRVDAHRDDSTIPTMRTSDFWKYGGITRDVHLVSLPSTFVEQYHVYLSDREKGEVTAWVQLQGNNSGKKVTLSIPEINHTQVAKTDSKGRAEFRFQANLNLWSPKNPKLYEVHLSGGGSQLTDRIGFRSIEAVGKKIHLNGQPIKMRGISMHEESPLHNGMAKDRQDAEVQLGLIKELGGNFVRLAHYPHNEYTLKVADELGLMVWSEIPVVSLIDWKNTDTLEVALTQVTDNINRDLNRASIVMWSVSNETFPKSDVRLNFLRQLVERARSLDDSNRLITSALIGNPEEFYEVGRRLAQKLLQRSDLTPKQQYILQQALEETQGLAEKVDGKPITVMISDPLGDLVDIVGYNEYFGWYNSVFFSRLLGVEEQVIRRAIFQVMPDMRFANAFGKPMIISEFGAGAKKGNYSKEALLWSEEYQAKVYRAQLEMLSKSEFVQGMSPWVLKDFRSHLREFNGIHDNYNRKGLISEVGEKKQAFFVLKEFYQQLDSE